MSSISAPESLIVIKNREPLMQKSLPNHFMFISVRLTVGTFQPNSPEAYFENRLRYSLVFRPSVTCETFLLVQ